MQPLDARFVLSSPFQALMAVEAVEHYGIDPASAEVVLLHSSEPRSVTALRSTVSETGLPWRVIDTGLRTPLRQVPRAAAVRRLARRPVDRLFIGDLRNPHMTFLAAEADIGSVVVLDDGRGTIQAAAARAIGAPSVPESSARRLQLRALGLLRPAPRQVEFFSIFRLETRPPDRAVENRLSLLRQRVSAKDTSDHTLLLGSPFVELGSMTPDVYIELVHAATVHLGGRVVFRPHRRERADKLARIEALGIEIDPGEGPVEADLLGADELPSRVSSFFSTATYTLWRLLGGAITVDSFRLRPDDFTDDFLDWNDGVPDLVQQSDGAIAIMPLDRAAVAARSTPSSSS